MFQVSGRHEGHGRLAVAGRDDVFPALDDAVDQLRKLAPGLRHCNLRALLRTAALYAAYVLYVLRERLRRRDHTTPVGRLWM